MQNQFKSKYPQVNCYWDVYFGDLKVSATEVSGLKETIELIPYRSGSDPKDFPAVQGASPSNSRVTIKWPIFYEGENGAHIFQDWRDKNGQFNRLTTVDVTITLLNEHQEPVLYWVCRNCNPIEYIGPDLKGDKAEIAIQTMTIATNSIKSQYVKNSAKGYIDSTNMGASVNDVKGGFSNKSNKIKDLERKSEEVSK